MSWIKNLRYHSGQKLAMATQSQSDVKELNLTALKAACSTCSLRELCLPIGLSPAEVEQIDQIIRRRRQFKRGICMEVSSLEKFYE